MRLLFLASLLVAFLVGTVASAQAPTCAADAAAVDSLLRSDYAGRALVEGAAGAERSAALASLLAGAGSAADEPACDRLLHAATALFPDGHLEVASLTPSTNVRDGVRRFSPWSGETGIRFLADGTAVIRIRSFAAENKPLIDSLVAAHAARLAVTPRWVVDVTMNGGGSGWAFEALLPYLATGPVRQRGAEVTATAGNRAYLTWAATQDWADAETRDWLHGLAARIDAAETTFVPMFESGDVTTEADSVTAFPRAVAVLTDAGTGSSAEEFVLVARQSAKVVVVGGSTYGALDYSNVREVPLPSGARVLHLPMTRRSWLPETSVDAAGIAPDVWAPEGVADWTAFALGVLAARDAAATAPSVAAAR